MQQYYIQDNRPASSSAKDLFIYCVKKVIDGNRFSQSMMHNQWAAILFAYEKSSTARIDLMSKVKREYSTYFTHMNKYSFDEDFIKRIKIGTVHTFQGSECDIIIFDMVDCFQQENGKPKKIGRLYSGENGERLLNVAVSRARHKLIIVCDPEYIKNIPGNTMTPNSQSLFNKLSKYSN